jgi:outer membrane autotransporter protein
MRLSHTQLRPLPIVLALQAALCSPIWAADFTVAPNTTNNVAQSIANGNTGTVNGTLSIASGIAVTVTGTTGTASIVNSGTIEQTGTGRTIDNNTSGVSLDISNSAGALISSLGDDTIRVNKSNANAAVTINNNGTIWQRGGVNADGDAAGLKSGQAIDLEKASKATINNGSSTNANAIIRADGDDAIRAGNNTTINNYGTIVSNGKVNTSCPDYLASACDLTADYGANDAIDAKESTGVVVNNFGTISGPRHGITADVDVAVNNAAGAVIIGRNGSGVGSDGTGTVVNRGLISGRYAGPGNIYEHLSGSNGETTAANGDGDGVDIDGIGTVKNYGRIEGLGGGGMDSGGRPNGGDGVAMGGGTIENHAGATIWGKSNGILVDDGANGTDNTTITQGRGTADTAGGIVSILNDGAITGDQKVAIGLVGDFGDTLINGSTGVITGGANAVRVDELLSATPAAAVQMGGGNDTLTNYGRIEGKNGMAIDMGDGDDIVNLYGGSIVGTIDGGSGNNLLHTNGIQSFNDGQLDNFQNVTVQGGSTTFNAALNASGNVQIDASGNLQVKGNINAGNLTVNGTLQTTAGSSFRTTTLTGNYAQGATGILETHIGANDNDKIVAAGTATLDNGATIRPLITGAVADGSSYTLISAAGGMTADAANLNIASGIFYSYTLETDSDTLKLVAHREHGLSSIVSPRFNGVANALDALASNADSQQALDLLNAFQALPNANAIAKATEQLAPETNGAMQSASMAAQGSVFSAFDNRVDAMRNGGSVAMDKSGLAGGDSNGARFWVQGLVSVATQKARKGANGFDLDAQGLAVGFETDLSTRDMVGLSGGYTQAGSDGRNDGDGDDTDVKALHLGGYFSRTEKDYTFDASVALSSNRYDAQRRVDIPGFTETLKGKYSGYQLGARVEYGIPFVLDNKWSGRWLVGARATRLNNESYTETGGASAQHVKGNDANSFQSVLGAEFVNRLNTSSSATLRARYLHEFADTPAIDASFVNGGPSFKIDGVQPGRDALQLGLGYRNVTTTGTIISIGYDLEIRDRYLGHQLTARASWQF